MSADPLRAFARFQARLNNLDPDQYERQIEAESSFNPDAVSPKGARGIAQFIPDTGRAYGLVSDEDFRDPWKSLAAGARHMRDLRKQAGGDERAALVGYNAGPRRMLSYLRSGNTAALPRETQGYISKIATPPQEDGAAILERFKRRLEGGATVSETATPGDPTSQPSRRLGPRADAPVSTALGRTRLADDSSAFGTSAAEEQLTNADDAMRPQRAPLAPRVAESMEVSAGEAMPEGEIYRNWYEARRSGDQAAMLAIGRNYLSQFPTGQYAQAIRGNTPRGITSEGGRERGAGATFPVARILEMRKSGADDETILRAIQDDVGRQMGLSESDLAVLTGLTGKHPLSNIVEPGSDTRSSVEGILRQGQSNAGVAEFKILPETVREISSAARALLNPEAQQAEATRQPHLYEGFIPGLETARKIGKGLGEAYPYLQAGAATRGVILPDLTVAPEELTDEALRQSGAFAANAEQAMLSGLTAPFKGIASLREGLLRGRGRVSDQLRELGTIGENLDVGPEGVRLRDPNDPSYRKAFAQSTADSLAGQFGQAFGSSATMMMTGAGLSGALGISGSAAAAATGALQQAGQTYEEAIRHGASREEAAAASIFGALIGLSEGWGLGGAIDRIALKQLSKNLAKEFLREGLEEAGQEGFQNFAQDVLAHYTYDPMRGVFTPEALLKNLKAAAVGFVTGGVLGGGGHAASSAQERLGDSRLVNSVERRLAKGRGIDNQTWAEYEGAVARQIAREQGVSPEEEVEEGPVGSLVERLRAQGETLVGRSMPSITPSIIHTPLNQQVDPETVRAEVSRATALLATETIDQTPQNAENATVPEAPETIAAQLEALREGRGNRRAVLISSGEQMPATKGALESQGLAVTETDVGTFIHSPRAVSRKQVRQLARDRRHHELLGIVERKSESTTETVVARDPETGTELQAAVVGPENVPAQADELQAQFPGASVNVEAANDVIAARLDEVEASSPTSVDAAAHTAATSPANQLDAPTEAQIEAGNYAKGHARIAGMDVSIENPEGSRRRPEWPELKSHYGYIRKTEGSDGEQLDVFIKPGTSEDFSGPVFVVDQVNADGSFDEHKVMLGFSDLAAARQGYRENYTRDFRVGDITEFVSPAEFREWLKNADTTKPAASTKIGIRGSEERPGLLRGTAKLIAAVKASIGAGEKLDNRKLTMMADAAFGGTRAKGTYGVKDATDALEVGVNQFIEPLGSALMNNDPPHESLGFLREILENLPRQADRSTEQVELQQFSTPPTEAFVAALALAPREGETVLEPSAGTGSLAIWARAAGANVITNEIDPRRRALLQAQGFETTNVDAQFLADLLPEEIQPTAILMNPPFSATGGRAARHDSKYGAEHVEDALLRLAPGGRLVAIVSEGMALDKAKMQKWWEKILGKYNVRANISVPGEEYGKYGTTYGNQMVVIDKVGPTPGGNLAGRLASVVQSRPANLEGVLDALQPIIADRPRVETTSETAGSTEGVETPARRPGRSPRRSGSRESTDRGAELGRPGESGAVPEPSAEPGSSEGSATLLGGEPTSRPTETDEADSVRQSSRPDSDVQPLTPKPKRSASDIAARVQARLAAEAAAREAEKAAPRAEQKAASQEKVTEIKDRRSAARDKLAKLARNKLSQTGGGVPIDPDEIVAMVDYLQTFIEEGVVRFEDAMKAFISDFGDKAHLFSRAFEIAWEELKADYPEIGPVGKWTEEPSGPPETEAEAEDEGDTFVAYKPAKLKGGVRHPGNIVESASMAAVEPPDITYKPRLDPSIFDNGVLSDLQYEAVAYAGQRHEQKLPNGNRAGMFIGDGTGVGKGRILAGIALDNWNQGRRRILWLSVNNDLLPSTERDLKALGGKVPLSIINDHPAAGKIAFKDGVLFSSYSTLVSQAKSGQQRIDQIREWLGDDGVIMFDEAHLAKNAVTSGQKESSQRGQKVVAIQEGEKSKPDYRIVYASATGATDVENMGYMVRLGLWGPGTSFPGGFNEFRSAIETGGVGAMEMVSRDMKAMGMYTARTLSFKGVDYQEVEHKLSDGQRELYDLAARAWQTVLQNIEAAITVTNANAQARSHAMKRFWNDEQRFFRQFITALKIPTAIAQTERAIADGHSVILGLYGTGEARTKDQVTNAMAKGQDLDDLDFSPKEILIRLVDNAFPTTRYTDATDHNGKPIKVPVLDADGNPVQSAQAVAMKKALLEELDKLSLPDNPLDQIVNHFGPDKVAEITGRKKRLVRGADGKTRYVKRVEGVSIEKASQHEMDSFQDGRKRIAIISAAASTGISLHADNARKNKQRRVHITLETGWSADIQMQTFGRSHRTNQASAPKYELLAADIGGEKRFLSTIAKRLASLGALTKGERKATGVGSGEQEGLEKYDFLNQYGTAAIRNMINSPRTRIGNATAMGLFEKIGLVKEKPDGSKVIQEPTVERLLNRVLCLEIDQQNAMFGWFTDQFARAVQIAKEQGVFDEGVSDIKGESIRLVGKPEVVATDKTTGAQTLHYQLEVDEKTDPVPFSEVQKEIRKGDGAALYKQIRSGNIILATRAGAKTDEKTGRVIQRWHVTRPGGARASIIEQADLHDKYQLIRPEEAKDWWNAEFDSDPGVRTKTVHLIGGTILPLWQRIEGHTQGAQTVRVITDDKQRILGVHIPTRSVGPVLRAIGVQRSFKSAEQIFKGVLEDEETIELVGGLRLEYTRFKGDDAIELRNADYYKHAELKAMGLLHEIISYRDRFFVPSDEKKGIEVLSKLLERYPALSASESQEGVREELRDQTRDASAQKRKEGEAGFIRLGMLLGARGGEIGSPGKLREMKREKEALSLDGYPVEKVDEFVDRYYQPKAYESLKGQVNVYLVMPSTRGENIIPERFARRLQQDFGGEIVADFALPVLAPYAGRHLVIVDDVYNTGVSVAALRQAIEGFGITDVDVAALGRSDMRMTSDRDVDRLSKKIAVATGVNYNTVREEVATRLQGSSKQFFNYAEREASRNAKAAARVYDAIREANLQTGRRTDLREDARGIEGVQRRPGQGRESEGTTVRRRDVHEVPPVAERSEEGEAGSVQRPGELGSKPTARESLRDKITKAKRSERRRKEQGSVRVGLLLGGQGGDEAPSGWEYDGFEDDEMEQRWKAAKGIRPEPLWVRVKETLTHLKNLATREFEHLPRTAEHAEFRFALKRLEQGKAIQSDEAVRILQGLTAKLDKKAYDLYTRRIILSDLVEEMERQAEENTDESSIRLPFGFTPDSLLRESQRLRDALDQRQDVLDAVAQRRRLIKEVTGEYLNTAKTAIGFEPKLTREQYYHHQVIEYANASVKGTGQKIQAPTGRGFLKRRHGSNLDINTEYIQGEHAILAQMMYDTQVFKLLHLVDEQYNLSERLKSEAKHTNAEALQEIIDDENARGLNKPKKKTKRKTLSEWVRSKGGMRPNGYEDGELDRLRRKESGTTGLVSDKSDYTPAHMQELAVEAGYFSEDSDEAGNVGNFIEAVEMDHRGVRTVYSLLDEDPEFDRRDLFPTVDAQMKLFKQKIGRGFSELGDLAVAGELWEGDDGEWKNAVRRLRSTHNHEEDLNERNSLFRYLAALAANEEATGNMQARVILKAISQRRAFVKKTLGRNYKTWQDMLPESHTLWQPREGNVFFTTYTLPEKLINQALETFYETIGFDSGDLRRAMVMGGRRTEFAIPTEVATTLDEFAKPSGTNPVDQAVRATVRGWKVWQLLSPHRVFKYNARNLSGDSDAVFVGNPSAFLKVPKAAADLWEYLGQKGAPTPELQEWLERGGLQNLFQVAEDVGSINGLKVFRNLELDKKGDIEKIKLWKQYWRGVRMATDFREALLRYSAFIDYREQMIQNRSGKPKNYGASIPQEVDAMSNISDKAYKLANDLLGAYDEVTVMGQWLREHLFPFWSWQEVNAKRYYRLVRNAIHESRSASEAGRKLLPKALRASPIITYRVGKFALKATLLWALLEAWNHLVFPDEEKDLDEKTRSRMHIVLGRRGDGSVIYFDRLGMLGDFLSWFGLDEAPHHVRQLLDNKKTLGEIAVAMAKAPANKLWQGTGLPKTIAEVATGRNTYPDVFRSRNVRDRWEFLANSFGVGDEYRAVAGKPNRGPGRYARGFFVYEVQPEESAYNEILSLKSDFNRKRGKAADVSAGNDKSNAAYYLKLALRYGDIEAARRYLAEYKLLGGTAQGLQESIKSLSPLAGLSGSDKAEFLNALTPDENERLTKAQMFYDAVIDRSGDVGPADLLSRPIPRETRAPVDRELQRLRISFPFPQNEITIAGKQQQMPAEKFAEFEQRVAEGFYRELGDMLSKPVYQRLNDADRKLAIEDFKRAWVGNERRRLHGQTILDSGATGRAAAEARRDVLRGDVGQRLRQKIRESGKQLQSRPRLRGLHQSAPAD
jgi:hypothetical protein